MPCNQKGLQIHWAGTQTNEVMVVGIDYRIYHIYQRYRDDRVWSGFKWLNRGTASPLGRGLRWKRQTINFIAIRVQLGSNGKDYCSNGHQHKWGKWHSCVDW